MDTGENPKAEIRNPKEIRMAKAEDSRQGLAEPLGRGSGISQDNYG